MKSHNIGATYTDRLQSMWERHRFPIYSLECIHSIWHLLCVWRVISKLKGKIPIPPLHLSKSELNSSLSGIQHCEAAALTAYFLGFQLIMGAGEEAGLG